MVIGGAVLGALLLALIVWRFFLSGGDEAALLTAEVGRGDIEQTVEATGTLEPKELISVGAQVSGRIETLNVEIGQTVRKGELIAQIDAQTQTNTLRTARAELANMQAQRLAQQASLTRAELAFRRQQALVPGEATSMADFEAAEADLKSARAQLTVTDTQIQQARVAVNTAEVNLGYTQIVAPMDGVVVAVVTKQGQTVNANQSAPTIVILAQLDIMEIKAEISEADVIKVEPGLPVYFTILGDPERRYEAKLSQVEPAPESIVNEVDSSSTSSSSSSSAIYYNALFEVPNTDGKLRALMTAQVSIVLASKKDVLTIPSAALGAKGKDGRYAVRVMDADGRIATRQVQIGLNNNVSAEVIAGLKQGEKVIVGEASATTRSSSSGGPMGPPPF
ncbi:MAG TPA: efflux RND transporter periplasmic adaptor subunit [Croceibacterium sp.]|nr:efflux RND transporter periplasmic adaptor subunit [Croceibacterium sp.]